MRTSLLGLVVCGMVAAVCWAADVAPTTSPTLQSLVDDLRVRGMPTRIEDLRQPEVPPAENGVVLLRQAIDKLDPKASGPRNSADVCPPGLPRTPEWFAAAEASEKANAEAMALARQARIKGKSDWGERPTSPLMDWFRQAESLSPVRGVANAIADSAELSHFRGRDDEAFEKLHDMEFIATSTSGRAFLVAKLVAAGIRALEPTMVLAIDLKVGDKDGHVKPEVVQQFIKTLLDDRPLREQFARAIREERVLLLDHLQTPAGRMIAFTHANKMPEVIAYYDAFAEAAFAPIWQQPQPPAAPPGLEIFSANRARLALEQQVLLRRISAVALAVALYRHDTGNYPAALQDLAPKYLASVPVDPFSREKGPLLYRRAMGGQRPMVGSVGEDGAEARVPDELLPPEPNYGWPRREPGGDDDVWLDLSGWRQQR
jgi:hypothetical protein